jgi:hypothetical protein
MLPDRHSALTRALTALDHLQKADEEVRLRVGLPDGSVVDGFLLSAAADHLSLRLPSAKAQYIPADQIHSVHLARRRSFRELAPVSVIILGTTAAIAALYRVPGLHPHLPRIVGGLVILEFALLVLLMKRTALGSWLTSWKTLFDVRTG